MNRYKNMKLINKILKPKSYKDIIDVLSLKNKVEIIDLLVKAIIDENFQNVNILLSIGVDLEFKLNGWTPLMWAVNYSTLRMIRTLLDAGADVNTTSEDGDSSIDMASNTKFNDDLFMLLKEYDK